MHNVYVSNTYLDANGTTEPYRETVRAVANNSHLGNASSFYGDGAKHIIDLCTNNIQRWCGGYKVIYTSGASESNNLIIRSCVDKAPHGRLPHIVLSAIEHKTSIDCCKQLAAEGRAEYTLVPIGVDGRVSVADVITSIRPNTVLVSIMAANNETGIIQPVEEIGSALKTRAQRPLFHVDAVQTFGKYPMQLNNWGIDAISVSFHKLHGPTGVGCLVLRNDVELPAQIAGSQNAGIRGGTENVAGIAGAQAAMCRTFANRQEKNTHMRCLREQFIRHVIGDNRMPVQTIAGDNPPAITDLNRSATDDAGMTRLMAFARLMSRPRFMYIPLTDLNSSIPNTLLLSVVKIPNAAELADMSRYKHFCNIQLRKDLGDRGVIVSIGSACATGSSQPSHVLMAMGVPHIVRCGVVRVSVSDLTTHFDIWRAAREFIRCVEKQSS